VRRLEKMKIIVIGSGRLGQRHLDVWSQMDEVEIVGIIARNKTRLKDVANTYGINSYGSIAEAIAKTDVDIFDICTPTNTHVSLIKEAAKAKKHIICEKPLSLNVETAKEAATVCAQNNVQLLIGHTLRFFPEYMKARKQILEGAIGKPGVIRMKRGVPHPSFNSSWYADEKKSGGLFVDLGIHDFDWLLWTFGEVQRVMARHVKYAKDNGNHLEYGLVTLRMSDGTIAYVELSWAEHAFHSSIELAGSKGMITYDHDQSKSLELHIRSQDASKSGRKPPKHILKKSPYYRQLKHFLNCILGKEEPVITVDEAIQAVKVTEAIVKSVRNCQPVSLIEGGV